jgi:HAMP domain-containing protein
MIPKTLRLRLPLSYAGIALIATLVLGAVLLTTLQRFYRQQELDYLTGNAFVIGERLVPLLEANEAGQLRANLKGLAFLSQTRVQVWTPKEALLADSGDPRQADENTQIAVSVEVDGVAQTFEQTAAASLPDVSESTIVIEPGFFANIEESIVTEVVDEGPANVENDVTIDSAGVITRTTTITREVEGEALPVVGTQFGFGFGTEDASETAVSNLTVRRPIETADGRLLGFVELSEGPAYGRDILQSVFGSWLVASLVAVLLAGWVGWQASRRLVKPLLTLTAVTARMADGDLAARTAVQRQDELGTLGTSFNKMADQLEGTITTRASSSPTPPTNCTRRSPRCKPTCKRCAKPSWSRGRQPKSNGRSSRPCVCKPSPTACWTCRASRPTPTATAKLLI